MELLTVVEVISQSHFLEEVVEVSLPFFVDFLFVFEERVFAGKTRDQTSWPHFDHCVAHLAELIESSPFLEGSMLIVSFDEIGGIFFETGSSGLSIEDGYEYTCGLIEWIGLIDKLLVICL